MRRLAYLKVVLLLHMLLHPDQDITLELTAAHHADTLLQLVNENREHLATFLPWVPNMLTAEDFHGYIRRCEQWYNDGTEMSFVIYYQQQPVGRIGIHDIHAGNRSAAIGYWLIRAAEGYGIITRCCRTLIGHAFDTLHLHRLEIKAAVDNNRSRAIPRRLGFRAEGILRQAELIHGHYHDLELYSLLRGEWSQ